MALRPAEKSAVAFAAGPVLAVVALKCALELAVAGRYGWHRDELYYAVAGLHLQGGYVEFPPVTALLAALARELFGLSLVGLRAFTILASAGTVVVGALVARELGATRRAQTLAAVMIGFSPGMLATNLLFQPVALDQLTTMVVLWLALRLALGRGSWPLLGVAAGIGLETKYTIAVVLVLLVATFLVWRRDVLRSWGFPLAVAIAAALLVPNLVVGGGPRLGERALVPEPSAERERRDAAAVHHQRDPAHGGRVPGRRRRSRVARPHARCARSAGRSSAPSSRTSCSAGSRTTRCRWWCSRSRPVRSRSIAGRRVAGSCGPAPPSWRPALLALPITLPVLPLHTAVRLGVVKARGDYQSEVGWPAYVRLVERHAAGADVIVADNYGEAGALELFGRRLPPVASADVTMRYWRPQVAGRQAVVVGYSRSRRRLLHGVSRRRAHLRGERQRRGRRADRALHPPRHAREGLAEHRRDTERRSPAEGDDDSLDRASRFAEPADRGRGRDHTRKSHDSRARST